MNIILLSGGSGKRLWPLSNDIRSKQFIKILKNENGDYESMVQRIYRKLLSIDSGIKLTIATSKSQVSALHNQLGEGVGISVEPERRDTFPAIALAASYLKDRMQVGEDEPVVVCPVDPYVEDNYFSILKEMSDMVGDEDGLVLMGIEPTEPSEKFGYIIPTDKSHVSEVRTFKEKPDTETAKSYINEGALWNGGVFAFRLGYLLERAHELLDFENYEDLYQTYDKLEKISFDYAVVEKEEHVRVVRYAGRWQDLGTWDVLTEVIEDNVIGNAIVSDSCENVHVINELDTPMICMGLKDVVAFASPDGILVSDKEQSSKIKPFVDSLNQIAMYQEKSYGVFRIIDIGEESLTIKVDMDAGEHMHYHSHEFRDEVYTVIEGTGRIIVGGIMQTVRPGNVVTVPAGSKHTVIADTDLKLIEVQIGKSISIKDKTIYNWEF